MEKYDYHPVMPVPDTESPEQSLGDCVICMDAIIIAGPGNTASDPRRKSLSDRRSMGGLGSRDSDGVGREKDRGSVGAGVGGIIDAVQMGFAAAGRSTGVARKSYALAPCHHLFVSGFIFASIFSTVGY